MSDPYDDCLPEPVPAAAGCPPVDPADNTTAEEQLTKLCELLEILLGTDPDGDGILNVDANIDLGPLIDALEGCLSFTNCVSAETGEPIPIAVDLGPILESCLSVGNCVDTETGEPVPVVVTFPDSDAPPEACYLLPRDVDGCGVIDGKRVCLTGRVADVFVKVGETATLASSTEPVWYNPDGTEYNGFVEAGPCPCVAKPACVSCWVRREIVGESKTDLADLLGLGPTSSVTSFTLTVDTIDTGTPTAFVVDCDGIETALLCGDKIELAESPCADWSGPFQTIITGPQDRVTITAVVTSC